MEVPLGDTYYIKFTTRSFSTGAPTQLAGASPAVSVYEEANLTQITSGVTLTIDYNGITGLNDVAIAATTGNTYEVGKYYSAVISGTATVGGVSVAGEVIGHFRVMPAEDAGAGIKDVNTTHVGDTLQTPNNIGADVDAILLDTGELQTNQGNWLTATGFATPTNITAATGITVATMGANTITAGSIAVGAIEADAFAAGAINAAAIAADAIGASELAADAVTEIQSGLATAAALTTVESKIDIIDANVDTAVAGIITGSAVTGTLNITTATTDLTGYTVDQLIGRLLTWTSGVLDGEQTDITDYAVTGGTLTYTAVTLAPGNGDTFKIT